ncbi:MFS transporter [Sporomusa aerivorans]|uniref:MFS transporter n=1 Tax=Sporomusa aerivorans TaxID=204936 RepID=UPI00352A2896
MEVSYQTSNQTAPKQSMARAVLAGSIGNALEWFDYGLYGYFAAIISSLFFPSKDPLTSLMLTFIVFGVGFVMRPLGGLIFGHYADKAGRRKALAVTVILMGASTFAIGCLPTYAQIGVWAPILLAVFRLIQGISTGGEWGSCMSFLAEYGNEHNRGFIVSWSQFSIAVGLLLGSALGTILTSVLSTEALHAWGWRIPFWSGLLIALFGMYVRSNVEETPKYKEMEQAQAVANMPVIELLKKYRRETIVNVGVVIGWTISYWVTMAYMPTYISKVLKYPLWIGMSFNTVLLIIFMIAIPFAGMLADRIGRKPVMMTAAAGFIVLSYPLFYLMSTVQTAGVLFFVMMVLALLQALICGGATVFIPEIFPTHVRCSAIGVGYNFAVAVFGGTAPFVATWLISATGDNLAPTYYLIAGAALTFLVLAFLAEETYKKPLK